MKKSIKVSLVSFASAFAGLSMFGCKAEDDEDTMGACSIIKERAITIIGTDHGHGVLLSRADIERGVAVHLEVDGEIAGHMHTLDITAENIVALKEGETIIVLTSTDMLHEHEVQIFCG